MDAGEINGINGPTINWSTREYVGDKATDSHSAMSRLSSRMGIRRTSANTSCAYIILSKIRKALRKASETADEKMRITYDRLMTKLEKLSLVELEYIHSLLITIPFDDVVVVLRTKATLIRKQASKWRKEQMAPDEEMKESDDPTENVMKYSEDISPEVD